MRRMWKTLQDRQRLKQVPLNKHNRATSDSDLDNQIITDKDVVLELVKQRQDKVYGDENYLLK